MAAMVLVQGEDARFRAGKFCQALHRAMNGRTAALANATGIYPGQLTKYADLKLCTDAQLRQPFVTADVILKGLMEAFGESGRLAGIEMVEMLCARIGGHFVADAGDACDSVHEAMAQKDAAEARVDVATLRALEDGQELFAGLCQGPMISIPVRRLHYHHIGGRRRNGVAENWRPGGSDIA